MTTARGNGMKVVVYGICKDESQFVDRWMDSMEEADQVVVLDTGSQDDTVEKLRRRGAVVEQEIIQPWRFDTARNRSMALIPADADVCVCTDLDEAFHPGWRAALERAWTPDATQGRYRYTWSFQPDGREGVVFYPEKIHRNGGFRWVGPVHEVLRYQGSQREKIITLPGVQLDHQADPKILSQYLPLLELAVAEEPENDRSAHYLGREYMFHGMWRKSIAQLQRHLTLKSARWADERCASMRYIARDYVALEDKAQALVWLLRAAAEAPYTGALGGTGPSAVQPEGLGRGVLRHRPGVGHHPAAHQLCVRGKALGLAALRPALGGPLSPGPGGAGLSGRGGRSSPGPPGPAHPGQRAPAGGKDGPDGLRGLKDMPARAGIWGPGRKPQTKPQGSAPALRLTRGCATQ